LFDHILAHRYLKEKDASKLFAQLISGVHYLHRKKIVHRDLKLENLLLDKHRNVIITDFGFANRFEHRQDDLMATSCGSPCYAAPELVVSDGLYVGSAVDIWSCGVILYAMLSGYLPFDDDPENPDGDNINLLYKYILNTPLTFPDWVSPAARDLMACMLIPDPERRFTLEQVMHHPWLEPYRPLFARSVNEMETIAQEQMLHKRQASRRDMQARMKAREAARLNQLAQSAGVLPGQQQSSLNPASAQDHQRRHKSDMPMGFNMSSNPVAVPNGPRPIATAPISEQRIGIPPHSAQPIITSGLPPAPKQAVSTPTTLLSGTLSGSLPAESLIQSASRSRKEEDIGQDSVATEADARASARARADDGSDSRVTQNRGTRRERDPSPGSSASNNRSVSQNKIRHTIQVEYDGDAAYQRLLQVQASGEKARLLEKAQSAQEGGDRMHIDPVEASVVASPREVSPIAHAPATSTEQDNRSSRQPLTPMESQSESPQRMEVDPAPAPKGSEEPGSASNVAPGQSQQDIPLPESPVLSPSAIRLVPPTPVKEPVASSTTPKPAQQGPPRTELPLFAEDRSQAETPEDRPSPPRSLLPVPTRLASTSSYASSGSNPQTPRMEAVFGRPEVKISTQSRQPSIASTASLAADLAPSPTMSLGSHASGSTGAPATGKKDRSRKGMSMNSFGFGKLLSGGNMSSDSVANSGTRAQGAKESGGFLSRSGSVRDKTKKRVEQTQPPIKENERQPLAGTVASQT
jgi:protein-serine/threonine kinase